MFRISGGQYRGAKLFLPPEAMTRPTSQRAREALFHCLFSMNVSLIGAHVLDGFAGSGAIGLECLSRGAASCIFIEKDPTVQKILRGNIQKIHQEQVSTILGSFDQVDQSLRKSFDFIYLDPPYDMINNRGEPLYVEALKACERCISAHTVVVIETRSTQENLLLTDDLFILDKQKTYGMVRLWFLKKQ